MPQHCHIHGPASSLSSGDRDASPRPDAALSCLRAAEGGHDAAAVAAPPGQKKKKTNLLLSVIHSGRIRKHASAKSRCTFYYDQNQCLKGSQIHMRDAAGPAASVTYRSTTLLPPSLLRCPASIAPSIIFSSVFTIVCVCCREVAEISPDPSSYH